MCLRPFPLPEEAWYGVTRAIESLRLIAQLPPW